jgi:hypothetical protein
MVTPEAGVNLVVRADPVAMPAVLGAHPRHACLGVSLGDQLAVDPLSQRLSHRTPPPYTRHMTGRPGGGCADPRRFHPHWCGFCGAELLFSAVQCRQLSGVPPCPRCSGRDWRTEIDELTATDYRESPA